MISHPKVQVIKKHPDAIEPKKAHPADSGYDLSSIESFVLSPMERKLVDTGLLINVGVGWEGQVRPRSGNANKLGLTVLNSPGTIDGTYTGPLKVILINLGYGAVEIKKGDRIAQLVVQKVETEASLEVVTEFTRTDNDRGIAGFGSSGTVGG